MKKKPTKEVHNTCNLRKRIHNKLEEESHDSESDLNSDKVIKHSMIKEINLYSIVIKMIGHADFIIAKEVLTTNVEVVGSVKKINGVIVMHNNRVYDLNIHSVH